MPQPTTRPPHFLPPLEPRASPLTFISVTRCALQLAAPIRQTSGEQALIDRARTDPEAFGELYRLHYHAIASYLLRRTGDHALAEDLAADTFVAAMRGLPRYRDTGAGLRPWLYRIAANKANRASRKPAHPLATRPAAHDPDHERHAVLRAAIDTLPARWRTVITLAYWSPLTTHQIAITLGIAEGTVKSRLARAREALRREIEHTMNQEGGRP